MFCKHNYQYTQGHLYCTKCGHRTYGGQNPKKTNKKLIPIGIAGIIMIGIIVFASQNIPRSPVTIPETTPEFQPDNRTPDQNAPQPKVVPVPEPPSITLTPPPSPKQPTQQVIQPIIPDQTPPEPPENPPSTITQMITQSVRLEISSGTLKPIESDIQTVTYGSNQLKTDELELTIHNLINFERSKYGLKYLRLDPYVTGLARNHSKDMATRNFFDHVNPDGQDPTLRASSMGYTCHKELGGGYYSEGIAENIAQNNLYDSIMYVNGIPSSYDWNDREEIASSTVDGWMSSTGHRENILTESYDSEGLGVYVSDDDKVYITQDFC